jgi:hypothetical protein
MKRQASESSYESDESEYVLRGRGFVRPTKAGLKRALGNLDVNCDPMTKSAVSNIYTYWKDVDAPRGSDWLNDNPRDGFGCFENFGGKKVTTTRNVLYI